MAIVAPTVKLSYLLRETGWPASAIPDAQGVVGAESRGDTDARNKLPCSRNGDHAIGIFQICTVHAGKFGIPADRAAAEEWLKNAAHNSTVALAIWKDAGNTFSRDWSVWKNGSYRLYKGKDRDIKAGSGVTLPDVDSPLPGTEGPGVDVESAVVDPIKNLAKFALDPSAWLRVGKGAMGSALIIVGVAGLAFIVADKASNGQVSSSVKTTAKAVATKKVPKAPKPKG